ncbi:hypothetical protein M8542_11150 [Amycolatopsis sp. OK19-0408]|uniref:Uncharacterized protein n=1 Tax=Amycolatopsis iheyensis TaxID=2945988 RepID=A0A9X2NEZ7_9PSEU|nr:hypothetical protein [Amycolatopsis iheyensis]MCR6483375.1 hypothetical protein [Amycolatopsis iheyensis]
MVNATAGLGGPVRAGRPQLSSRRRRKWRTSDRTVSCRPSAAPASAL